MTVQLPEQQHRMTAVTMAMAVVRPHFLYADQAMGLNWLIWLDVDDDDLMYMRECAAPEN